MLVSKQYCIVNDIYIVTIVSLVWGKEEFTSNLMFKFQRPTKLIIRSIYLSMIYGYYNIIICYTYLLHPKEHRELIQVHTTYFFSDIVSIFSLKIHTIFYQKKMYSKIIFYSKYTLFKFNILYHFYFIDRLCTSYLLI